MELMEGELIEKGKFIQVTTDEVYENKKKGPSNYLGPANVDGVPLSERINIVDLLKSKDFL